jgi:hypothetical protein
VRWRRGSHERKGPERGDPNKIAQEKSHAAEEATDAKDVLM